MSFFILWTQLKTQHVSIRFTIVLSIWRSESIGVGRFILDVYIHFTYVLYNTCVTFR